MSISVAILTFNEEVNLAGAFESLAGLCDDVVVFDSFSTDRTKEIAERAGARVYLRRFDNYAAQRNAALTEVDYRYPWVFMLDADERMCPDLWREMSQSIASVRGDVTLFRMRRKDYFLGTWLRRSSGYPTWFGRLMRVGRVQVQREINEEYVTNGLVEHLREHIVHFPFNRGVAHWISRHNQYSTAEAARLLKDVREPLLLSALLSRDPTRRRKVQKQIAYRVPLRPAFVFLYLYFIRFGILDGLAGLQFCILRSMYEYMIDVKVFELRAQRSNTFNQESGYGGRNDS